MLQPPSDKANTKRFVYFLISLIVLFAVSFAVHSLFKTDLPEAEHAKAIIIVDGDTTDVVDISNWSSTQIDSFSRAQRLKPTRVDDSMYKAYGLDELNDSIINGPPPSPLVDSFLRELTPSPEKGKHISPN